MITVDTNIFVDFFRGSFNQGTDRLLLMLRQRQVIMNPFVLAEILSSPKIPQKMERSLLSLPRIEIDQEFFVRAGLLRRSVYKQGKGVAIADIYVAQACIDAALPLLSLDSDMLQIAKSSDLELIAL